MRKTEIYALAIKILGLYFFAKFVHYVIDFGYMINSNGDINDVIQNWGIYNGVFLVTLGYFVIAYLTTFKTSIIVTRVFPKDEQLVEFKLHKVDYLEIAMVIIAIVAITYSVPDILAQIIDLVYFKKSHDDGLFRTHQETDFLRPVFQFFVGLFLLMNARNFSKKIVRRGEHEDKFDQPKSTDL